MAPQLLPVLDLFRQTGAYLNGHFRLTSGLHSPEYLQCAKVLQYPRHAESLGRALAEAITPLLSGQRPDLVVAPAMGGLIIGHEVARAFGVRFVFTERDPSSGLMTLRRGFSLTADEKAILIEDVMTTGGSLREVVAILQEAQVTVLAAGSIIDRSGGAADAGVPRAALETLNVVAYQADACPLCHRGLELVKPGSRK